MDKRTEMKELRRRARLLRNNATLSERRMWNRLKGRQLCGWKFRRQHVLYPYIVDFYCPHLNLVVEVDGGYHGRGDRKRDAYLVREHGVVVLRFSNREVRADLESVLGAIEAAAEV